MEQMVLAKMVFPGFEDKKKQQKTKGAISASRSRCLMLEHQEPLNILSRNL